MITILGAYIKTITALTIFSALACMLMPDGSFRKYVELVLGIMILTAVLSPFLKLFGAESHGFVYSVGAEVKGDVVHRYEEVLLISVAYEQGFSEEAYG